MLIGVGISCCFVFYCWLFVVCCSGSAAPGGEGGAGFFLFTCILWFLFRRSFSSSWYLGWAALFIVALPGPSVSCFAGNDDIHKSSDEFEIRPDPNTDHRVSCP